ncbi:MAG: cohesin domain-containing protein [Syntrophotaleaceae bacterium]
MNKLLKFSWVIILGSLMLSGCAIHQPLAKGEELMAQGLYGEAVEVFSRALDENPKNHELRMKLHQAKSQAALSHLEAGKKLLAEGNLTAAANEFRQALFFDPSLVAGAQEVKRVQELLKAEELIGEAETLYQQRRFFQAKNLLERALELAPGNDQAAKLLKTIRQEQLNHLDGYELELASKQPITLKLQGVAVREAFSILSRLSGINFIFDETVPSDQVTLFLEKASFAQALDILLKMNDLGKRVLNSKTIILYPRTEEKVRQYEDQIIQVFYLSNIDAKKAINMLRTMLQLRKIYVHEELNAIVMRDKPDVIKLAQQILEAADRTDSEVVFALELVEVSHSDALDLGPRLSTYSISAGLANEAGIVQDFLPATGSTTRLVDSFGSLESFYTLPSATFEFAKTLTDSEILANPKIRVKNKQKAKIHIGTREPIATTSTSGDIVSTNVQYVDVGVKLDIEPVVQLNGSVVTNLTLEVSNVIDERIIQESGTTLLTISTTNAASSLILKDGERTIIGGLIRDDRNTTKTTIPFIGRIPLIGELISHRSKDETKREILLSITPHIVRKVDMPGPDVATIWSGGENELVAGQRFESFARGFEPQYEQMAPPVVPAAVENGMPLPLRPGMQDVAGQVELEAPDHVTVGDSFSLSVKIDQQENLVGAPLTLSFSPGHLEVVGIDEGDLLRRDGVNTLFSSTIDRHQGQIMIEHQRQPGAPGISGGGTLARVIFRAKAPGIISVELDSGSFIDPAGGLSAMGSARTNIEVRAVETNGNTVQ